MYALHQYSVKTTNKSCTLPLFPHASIFVDDRKVHVRFTTGLPGPPAAPRHASPGSGSRRHLRWQWTPPKNRTPGGWRLSAVQEVRRCKNLKDFRTIYLDLRSLPKEHTHIYIYMYPDRFSSSEFSIAKMKISSANPAFKGDKMI